MILHLVRHGQSVWNQQRRLQGQSPGVPLTDLGREQAREAARRLLGLVRRGAPVWSSDLQRAAQTAEIIAGVLGGPIHYDRRLREQHYGILQGRLTADLHPEPVPEGLDITEVRWGGGESVEQVYGRVRSFLRDLLGTGQEEAVAVTHGDTIRVALAVIDHLNRDEPDPRPHRLVAWGIVGNGSVTTAVLNPLRS